MSSVSIVQFFVDVEPLAESQLRILCGLIHFQIVIKRTRVLWGGFVLARSGASGWFSTQGCLHFFVNGGSGCSN